MDIGIGMQKLPVIRNGNGETGVVLPFHGVMEVCPVLGGVNNLDAAAIRTLQDTVPELPDISLIVGLQRGDGREVVNIDGTEQPASTTETGHVGC